MYYQCTNSWRRRYMYTAALAELARLSKRYTMSSHAGILPCGFVTAVVHAQETSEEVWCGLY